MFSKGIRVRAWHRNQQRMVDVQGILGMDGIDPVIQTKETTIKVKEVEMLIAIGEKDKKNTRIYQNDVMQYKVKNEKGDNLIVLALVKYINCGFKLVYSKEVGENAKADTVIKNVVWEKGEVVGNLYQPPKTGW